MATGNLAAQRSAFSPRARLRRADSPRTEHEREISAINQSAAVEISEARGSTVGQPSGKKQRKIASANQSIKVDVRRAIGPRIQERPRIGGDSIGGDEERIHAVRHAARSSHERRHARAARLHTRATPVECPAVVHICVEGAGESHDRIVGVHLPIVAIGSALADAVELRSQESVRAAGFAGHAADGRLARARFVNDAADQYFGLGLTGSNALYHLGALGGR